MSIKEEHDFNFDDGVCKKCGMSESVYEDSSQPECSGKKQPVKFGGGKTETKKPTRSTKFI